MLQKSIVLALVIVIAISITSNSAFGDIPIMSKAQRDQVFNRVPNFQGSNIDYFFKIIITPAGAQLNNIIVDQKNYTAIKNNVGFFTACGDFNNGLCEPPVVTTTSPTINYCPIAKMILLNQDGYLNKTYTISSNGTVIKDLTTYIYPVYCHAETGPNPINGDVSIPEFPQVAGWVLAILVLSMIVFTSRGCLKK